MDTRRADLRVTSSANGKDLLERDAFNVFIDHTTPDLWVITGAFTHARISGDRTVALQSGRLLYDVESDVVTDAHPGPHPTDVADVLCTSLA
jgi:hypothetical protein